MCKSYTCPIPTNNSCPYRCCHLQAKQQLKCHNNYLGDGIFNTTQLPTPKIVKTLGLLQTVNVSFIYTLSPLNSDFELTVFLDVLWALSTHSMSKKVVDLGAYMNNPVYFSYKMLTTDNTDFYDIFTGLRYEQKNTLK